MSKTTSAAAAAIAAADLLDLVIDRAPKLRDAGVVLRELTYVPVSGELVIKLDAAAREVTGAELVDPPKKRTMWNDPDLFPDEDDDKPAPKRKES